MKKDIVPTYVLVWAVWELICCNQIFGTVGILLYCLADHFYSESAVKKSKCYIFWAKACLMFGLIWNIVFSFGLVYLQIYFRRLL